MDSTSYIQLLNRFSRDTEYRRLLLNTVIKNQSLILVLLEQIESAEKQQACLAARTLELACKKDLKLILPYLSYFTKILAAIKHDAVARSFAKIIELFSIAAHINHNSVFIEKLAPYWDDFAEACFDFMINDKATAIQAHSMYSLYLLGTKNDWIHPELSVLLERKIPLGTVGYQNRARKIIKAIHTKKLFKL